MDAPTRSPILGYNHNVNYRGRVYHVQTEDSGTGTHRVFTHLFFGGTILASKKIEYDPFAPEDVVKTIMQGQHKAVLRELKNAQYDDKIALYFTARGETAFLSDPDAQPAAADRSGGHQVGVTPPQAETPQAVAAPPASVMTPPPVTMTPPPVAVTPPPAAAPAHVAVPDRSSQSSSVAGVLEGKPVPVPHPARPDVTPAPIVVELKPPTRRIAGRPAVVLDPELAEPTLRPNSIPPLPSTVVPDPSAAGRRNTPVQAMRTVSRNGATPPRVSMPGAQPVRLHPQTAVPAGKVQAPGSGVVVVQRNIVVGASGPKSPAGNVNRARQVGAPVETVGGQRPASSYRSGIGGARRAPDTDPQASRHSVDVQFAFPGERPTEERQPARGEDKGLDDVILEYLSEDEHEPKPPK